MPHRRPQIRIGFFISITVFLCLSGCATTPKLTEPIERNRVYDAAYDEIWRAAIQGLTVQNEMITMSQKDSGVIGVDREFDNQNIWNYVLMDGWTKFWTTWQKFHSRANMVIQPLEEMKTKVIVNVQIQGDYLQGQPNYFTGNVSYFNQQKQLMSNGKIEKEYLDIIEAQLPGVRKLAWLNEKPAQTSGGLSPTQAVQPSIPIDRDKVVEQELAQVQTQVQKRVP